jgi:hypothetical protein
MDLHGDWCHWADQAMLRSDNVPLMGVNGWRCRSRRLEITRRGICHRLVPYALQQFSLLRRVIVSVVVAAVVLLMYTLKIYDLIVFADL